MYKKTVKYELQNNFEDILSYKKQGMRNEDIAKIFNVSKSSITRLFQENGIYSRNLIDKESVTSSIITDYKQGDTIEKISQRYHTSQQTVSTILKENNIAIRPAYRTIYTLNESYFDIIDADEKAYIIGMLASDGCVRNNTISISLQECDKDILEKINICLNSNRPLYYTDNHMKGVKGSNFYTLAITNKHMANTLKSIGIVENKSLTLHFPDVINDELLPHFLRGLWDGDGFIEKKRFRTGCTGTIFLLNEIVDKVSKILNINFYMYQEHCNNEVTYTIKISNKNDCMAFLNYIYQDASIYLQRKYNIYQSYINKSLSA